NPATRLMGNVDDSLLVTFSGNCYIGTQRGFRTLKIEKAESIVPFTDHSFLYVSSSSVYRHQNNTSALFSSSLALTKEKSISLLCATGGGIWGNFFSGIYRWERNAWQCKMPAGAVPYGNIMLAENVNESGVAVIRFPSRERGLWEWSRGSAPARNHEE